jgi:type IV secretory pathway component VirB8
VEEAERIRIRDEQWAADAPEVKKLEKERDIIALTVMVFMIVFIISVGLLIS